MINNSIFSINVKLSKLSVCLSKELVMDPLDHLGNLVMLAKFARGTCLKPHGLRPIGNCFNKLLSDIFAQTINHSMKENTVLII